MAGLLKRLGRGLAAGMVSYGTSMLDQQRQDRLEKLKRDGIQAQKDEGQANRDARAEQADLDRKSREKIAGMRMGAGGSRGPTAQFENINWDEITDKEGNKVRTGSWQGIRKDGVQIRYDAETDTYTELGKGAKQKGPDPATEAQFKDSAKFFGQEWANDQSGWLSFDSSDFEKLPEQYRSEEKVGKLINEALLDIQRKHGTDKAQQVLDIWQNISDANAMFDELNAWLRSKKRIK